MNRVICLIAITLFLLSGCRNTQQSEAIVSMQMLDRNGFSETISNKERLGVYQNVDFLSSQPYEKVLRVYAKNKEGKSPSKLTSYHFNGGICQYLEALDGRAHGRYLEWHENGNLKIEAKVIEGLADLSETAQASWLFDETCTVWDQSGNKSAEFTYDKGRLVGEAKYYFQNGNLQKIIPYTEGQVDGILRDYDIQGNVLDEISYRKGKRDGTATSFWSPDVLKSQEFYREGLLIHGIYYDLDGNVEGEIADGRGVKADFTNGTLYSLTGYNNGVPEGQVQIFSPNGEVKVTYYIKDGKKTGEEWEFYLNEEKTPKLLIHWYEDKIQGMVKTWYPNGKLESQREMSNNKKHGLSFAYYLSGDLMLMEEYENDRLIKGSYYRQGEPKPASTIENGEGVAMIYSSEGHFIRKINYEKGKALTE